MVDLEVRQSSWLLDLNKSKTKTAFIYLIVNLATYKCPQNGECIERTQTIEPTSPDDCLAVGVGRVALPQPRHQDREQQPVRPREHQPQGVQEDPETGEKTFAYFHFPPPVAGPTPLALIPCHG